MGHRNRPTLWWSRALVAGALASAVLLAAWTPVVPTGSHANDHGHGAGGTTVATGTPARGVTDSSAATLRVGLNKLLAEHVYLAARATGAALGGQTAGFEAAAGALDANSIDLARAIGTAYGSDAEMAFLPLWRAHIGMVVEYTQGLATDDTAKQQKAVSDLVGYSQDFGAFLGAANENLPKDTVAELVKMHVLTLKDVIDAQKARDQGRVYSALREAMGHMSMVADPLAAATAAKFPDKFPGDAMAAGVSYRVAVNNLLAEHVYLAASAALGGLTGNTAQFQAAAAALDGNSVDLSRGIGAAYGPEAEAAFLPLWRSHIGMVVDYTVGKATNDQAMQDKAVTDLLGYSRDFGAFLSGANENLPNEVVVDLVKSHIITLKDVIDSQAAGDPTAHFTAIRMAAGHMGMIADPLAEATVAKFPEKFGGMRAMQMDSWIPAEIKLFRFNPGQIEVASGTTVTWTNGDAIEHTVTHGEGWFDSGLFTQGQTYSFTFTEPGQYSYFCQRHPSMQGVVSVS